MPADVESYGQFNTHFDGHGLLMKKRTLLALAFCILLLAATISCVQKFQSFQMPRPYAVEKIAVQAQQSKPKNIILMVGDGMSLATMYTAWTANRGHLNIENCRYVGLSKTYSADQLLTDSAAGGTAFATGHKTRNHSVGVDKIGTPQASILEIARQHGLATGLIATCNILDATPAVFVAKMGDRYKWNEIELQYVAGEVDFVCGGGWKYFKHRKDGRDLTKELAGKGYQLPRTVEELERINEGKVFALLADGDLPLPRERGAVLPRATMKAIELLSRNEKGFFLMIEGSMIDDGGHDNQLDRLMDEVHDFDRAVGKVLQWAAKDGETLVVVTADHETGGWTLLGGDIATGTVKGKFSTEDHSGVMVPVYSFGPKAETFTGIFENTDLFYKMLAAYGFGD
jgi:alkaline phosphatase